jgi:hypothetical protein
VVDVGESLGGRVRRPGFWWSWSGAFAVLGLAFGFAPKLVGDTTCGSALHPTNASPCEGRLDLRLTICLVLLGLALVSLAIGLTFSHLSRWRAAMCFAGIVGVAAFSFIALSALTHDEDAAIGYCGTYMSQPRFESDPALQASKDQECGPFRSRQLRLALAAGAGALASAGAIAVSVSVGRKREPVPHFVANAG